MVVHTQVPPSQASRRAQGTHGSPPTPQAPREVPGRQRPAVLQQPAQPVAALHWQFPPTQSEPVVHSMTPPH